MQPMPPCPAPTWLVVDTGVCASPPLGKLPLGTQSVGFNYLFIFSSCLCFPLRFQGSPQTRQWEFPGVWKPLFFKTPFPGWSSIPTSFVSLFIFYIFYYLLSKTMGCFSGCLMSSAGIQKLFCGIYSALKCSFDEFVGEKVVFLS